MAVNCFISLFLQWLWLMHFVFGSFDACWEPWPARSGFSANIFSHCSGVTHFCVNACIWFISSFSVSLTNLSKLYYFNGKSWLIIDFWFEIHLCLLIKVRPSNFFETTNTLYLEPHPSEKSSTLKKAGAKTSLSFCSTWSRAIGIF